MNQYYHKALRVIWGRVNPSPLHPCDEAFIVSVLDALLRAGERVTQVDDISEDFAQFNPKSDTVRELGRRIQTTYEVLAVLHDPLRAEEFRGTDVRAFLDRAAM